jgi:hypothetical protein
MKKFIVYLVGFICVSLFGMVVFSPYKNNVVQYTTIINAPAAKVFTYTGNANTAKNWSSYVNHITPLNPTVAQDGTIGSTRRCFKNADEQGIVWDEDVVVVQEILRRKLTIYNAKGFPIMANHLATEQLYHAIDSNKMQLTFTLFFDAENISVIDKLKMHFASYRVKSIFEKNLANIKHWNEQ